MVKAAPPRQSRTFRVAFEIPPDLEERLPGGKIEITAFVAENFLRARVDTVYVSIPEHGSQVATTKTFDDGAVVLDTDANGRPLGIELTTVTKGLPELPEFARYAHQQASKHCDKIPAVMVVTALRLARRYDLALIDSMATMRALAGQLADKGVTFQIDEVRIREAMVEVVQHEQGRRWMPELISA